MDAHRVEIFNRADDHALILVVTHDFHLVLFPPEQALFDEHFSGGGQLEAVLHHLFILFAVVGDAAA